MNLEESIRAWEEIPAATRDLWRRINLKTSLTMDQKIEELTRRLYEPDIDYDRLLRLAVDKYNLNRRSRRSIIVDQRQFLLQWWDKNIREFKEIKTLDQAAVELGYSGIGKHATVIHLIDKRTPTIKYKENTRQLCIDLEGEKLV
jgi:hypothetical protein